VLAGLRSLAAAAPTKAAAVEAATRQPPADTGDADEEIPAREAAHLLGLKGGTVRGYIRSGRLSGSYNGEPNWNGWLTTRGPSRRTSVDPAANGLAVTTPTRSLD
jgi:hypothetical protein